MSNFPPLLIAITVCGHTVKHLTITNRQVCRLENADVSTLWLACKVSEGCSLSKALQYSIVVWCYCTQSKDCCPRDSNKMVWFLLNQEPASLAKASWILSLVREVSLARSVRACVVVLTCDAFNSKKEDCPIKIWLGAYPCSCSLMQTAPTVSHFFCSANDLSPKMKGR